MPEAQRPSLAARLPRGGFNLRSLAKGAVLQLQSLIGNRAVGRLIQREKVSQPENKTGLPDNLKSGIENLSGLALDDVRVHYNSPQPARLNALAYAQGTDIHVAPGQERHLPHEAWHVVQQRQGRVRAIAQVEDEPLNDSPELEREAEVMGERALTAPARVSESRSEVELPESKSPDPDPVVQRALAEINYWVGDNNTRVVGNQVGQGGVGGVSHSEQSAWNRARVGILAQLGHAGRHVNVEFSVDTPICVGCANWFEATVYPALNEACADGSTFTLTAEVNENRVTIEGGDTIWTPEVADAHTYDRLSEMERSMLYLRENRDKEGELRDSDQSEYLINQRTTLNSLLTSEIGYQYHGLTLDAIQARLDRGKELAVNFIGEGMYNPDANHLTPAEYLDTISFSDVMFSERFAIHDVPAGENLNVRVTAWLNNLEADFRYYMTQAIEEHFEDYLIVEDPEENPHFHVPG